LQDVVYRGALFARALGETDEIDGLEMPRGSGEDAGGGDIVESFVDEAEVGEDVADERMLEDREARDDEGDLAVGELFGEAVAVIVLAIEDGEIAPRSSSAMEAFEFGGDPGGFFIFVAEFGDADALAFGVRRRENFVREVGADFVLSDDLGGNAEDVGSGAVILGEGDAIFRGVAASFPAGKAFEKEFEAAERGAAETVDGLIVVADGDDVARLGGEKVE